MSGLSERFLFTFSVTNPDGSAQVYTCAECGCSVSETRNRTVAREQHVRAGCNPNNTRERLVQA